MLAEAIEKIRSLAVLAAGAAVVSITNDPRHVIVVNNGNMEVRDIPPPDRRHKLHTMAAFVAALTDEAVCPAPEIFFSGFTARALCDRTDRRAFIDLALTQSDKWDALQRLVDGVVFTPKETRLFFRYELKCPMGDQFVQAIARIDFERKSSGRTVNEHGRESMGRDVEAMVQQRDQVPEEFAVTLAPFTDPAFLDFTVTCRIGVELDAEAQRISLRLLPDELDTALATIATKFRKTLEEDVSGAGGGSIPIFNGTVGV